jgi:hypothetical protein
MYNTIFTIHVQVTIHNTLVRLLSATLDLVAEPTAHREDDVANSVAHSSHGVDQSVFVGQKIKREVGHHAKTKHLECVWRLK